MNDCFKTINFNDPQRYFISQVERIGIKCIKTLSTEHFETIEQIQKRALQFINESLNHSMSLFKDGIKNAKKTDAYSHLIQKSKEKFHDLCKTSPNATPLELPKEFHLLMKTWAYQSRIIDGKLPQEPPFALSCEDFVAAKGVPYVSSKIPKCHDFAFYTLNERKAFPYVFSKHTMNYPDELIANPAFFLQNWGYKITKEPVNGDLVIYVNSCLPTSSVTHFGIWMNGKIISKWGNGPTYRHAIHSVPVAYGDTVYCFHKKAKTPKIALFLQSLKKASKALSSPFVPMSAHPAARAPLSRRGTIEQFETILDALPNSTQFLPNSLYNQDYENWAIFQIQKKIDRLRQMQQLPGKMEIIGKLNKTIVHLSNNTPESFLHKTEELKEFPL